MDKKLIDIVKNQSKIEPAALLAFIYVETGGQGFDKKTGKILIQFEPAWFKKQEPYAPSGFWSVNKVDVQSKEWQAFNDAWKINPHSAMLSTSIGLGQIMGFNYRRIGYKSVDEMWDDAKKGIDRQLFQIIKFIESDIKLISAIKAHDWDRIATLYNGASYKELAKKIGRESYDISLKKAYESFLYIK